MRRIRRISSVAAVSTALAVSSLAAMPAAQAGLEADAAAPPPAYVVTASALAVACELATVDLATGTVTDLSAGPSADACVIDLAVAPDGSVWGIEGPLVAELAVNLVEFDPATGAVLSTAPITGNFTDTFLQIGGLAFDGAGTLYAQMVTDEPGCDSEFVCLYTVDPATRVATFVGFPGDDFAITQMFTLAADCGTSMLTFVNNEVDDEAEGFGEPSVEVVGGSWGSYDKATGAVTSEAPLPDDLSVVGLDYAASGTLFLIGAPAILEEVGAEGEEASAAEEDVRAADFDTSLFTVDPATFELTLVAALSEPEVNLGTLGIAGSCVTPAPPPIVLTPTFTG